MSVGLAPLSWGISQQPAQTQEATAVSWLERMSRSFQATNYSLSLIRVHEQHFEPVAIEHGRIEGEELIYVNYLNGPEREVLHKNGTVTYFQHDEPPYSVSGYRAVGPIPRVLTANIKSLQEHYRFIMGGRNRIMGHAAQLIRIEPKYDDRYSLWVWLDAQQGMLLRADVVAPGGAPIEHVQIMSMQFHEKASSLIERLAQMQLPATVPLLESERMARKGRVQWRSHYLPKGFKLLGRDQHRIGKSNSLVDYQLYSDGISCFSIYVGAAMQGGAERTLVSQGATHLVTLVKDELEIAVIGSLPEKTLQRIADSVYSHLPQP